ncbi:MAG: FGGY-family carbohydrate kinase [Clostridia bacterium]|nr:FGGY-family carbohydrate kinase [Clostridia bacterium]
MALHVITYDVGTTGIKTCVFEISNTIKLVASAMQGYNLYIMKNGGAEQDPYDWWKAMCSTTKKVLEQGSIPAKEIEGISFCSQMQGLVLVDNDGEPIRPAMSYMDQRAKAELMEGIANGLQVAGANIFKLLKSLKITGAVAASAKDPVWKYKWVERHEPDNFKKVYKWLDVKEFLICKCTGKFVMTQDSAFATLLYDTRKGREGFSKEICKMLEVNMEHLPEIVNCTDMVGCVTDQAAIQLGIKKGTPVFGGGGDASLIGIGAGAVEQGSTHIYIGTSGWVSTVVDKQIVDTQSMIASIVGANPKSFNYFAELETAGKCLEWIKDYLALDKYDYMMHLIKDVPAGSHGVIFTPWLHGNRCPFEDSNARGIFFNISLATGRNQLIHAVIEGVCYHLRWQLEAQEKKVKTSNTIRFVGGGALAPLTCQVLSDVIGRQIQTVDNPQNVGAVGAAAVAAVGIGMINKIEDVKNLIKTRKHYYPNASNKSAHDKHFRVFKTLYKNNRKSFGILNRQVH